MNLDFTIDPKLENDSLFVTSLELCQVRLINNSDYTWMILVPQKNDLIEITDLLLSDYDLLCSEIRLASEVMQKLFKPNKLNIAMIGNMVRQLHVHIIARFENDKLFPKPVWGCEFAPYSPLESKQKISMITKALNDHKNIVS